MESREVGKGQDAEKGEGQIGELGEGQVGIVDLMLRVLVVYEHSRQAQGRYLKMYSIYIGLENIHGCLLFMYMGFQIGLARDKQKYVCRGARGWHDEERKRPEQLHYNF